MRSSKAISFVFVLACNYARASAITQIYSIATWGDSLTMGGQGGGVPYPTALATLEPGHVLFNGGNSGDTSSQIATRMLADPAKYRYTIIIWAGRNDYTTPNTVKANIAAMVAALPSPKQFLVLAVLNGEAASEYSGGANYAIITQLNADLAALYPQKYLDIRALLVAQFNPVIPQDVIDHGHDIPPSSLRFDILHLNTAGYAYVAQQVAAKLATFEAIGNYAVGLSQLKTLFATQGVIGVK
jgi:lysophospholipase L1-like esterase